ncbi:hypothetical protein OTK49_21045 [Vibrio coralliirubri]|uniref:hypothetical protein n=1 Tax=Vibrio coralliirubri TaxID=1516159 RepID=UPI002284ABD4|nr:hypothetical protein [Vibrio coralliirubri]MCY9865007.1 hypothetical protein [Vibrio coralliirubri]
MKQTYLYVPVGAEQSYEEAVTLISTLIAPCKIESNNDFSEHCIHHIKVSSGNGLSTWLMIMKNKIFASDPRSFLRIRLNGGIPALTEQLTQSTLKAGGYVGDCSKEFTNAQGQRVFNVGDGVGYISVSYGEVVARFEEAGVQVDKTMFEEHSTSDLLALFEKSVGARLTRHESDGSVHYRMYFEPQNVSAYQSKSL